MLYLHWNKCEIMKIYVSAFMRQFLFLLILLFTILSCGSVRFGCRVILPVVCCLLSLRSVLFYYDYYCIFFKCGYAICSKMVWCLVLRFTQLWIDGLFFFGGFLLFLSLEIVQSRHVYESELNKREKIPLYCTMLSSVVMQLHNNTCTMSSNQIKSEPQYLLIVPSERLND